MNDAELRDYYENHFLEDWRKPQPSDVGWGQELHDQATRAKEKMDFLSKHVPLAGRRVLHVRCQTGHFLKLIEEVNAVGVGIAVEGYYAGFAREAFGVNVVTAKLYDFTWPVSGTFDLIVLHHLLEHVQEPRLIIEQAKLLLSTGGHLLIEEHDKLSNGLATKRGQPYYHLFNIHLNNFTFSSMRSFIKRVGLDIVAEHGGAANLASKHIYLLVQKSQKPEVSATVRLNNPISLVSQFCLWHLLGVWQYRLKGVIKSILGRNRRKVINSSASAEDTTAEV